MPRWPDRETARQWLAVVREVAITDFRLKYNDSLLGYAWGMLSPVLMLAIYWGVFRHVLGVRTPGYEVYLLVGVVYWTFFQDCSFSGLTAIVGKAAILRAVRLPAAVVVASGALSSLITLTINSVVLVLVLAVWGKLSPLFPLAVIPIVCLALLASGLSFIVALAYVHFRDAGLVWNVAMQALFWMTPVVYPVRSGALAEILYLNPIARCLYLIRWFLVADYQPAFRFFALTVIFCVAVFAIGLRLFLRRQHLIPESL